MILHVFKMHVNFGKMVRPPMAFPCVDDVAVLRIRIRMVHRRERSYKPAIIDTFIVEVFP